MIKLVAFDLDGTIADTIPLCIEAFRQAVAPYSGYLLSDQEIINTFGLNEMGMIKAVLDCNHQEALNDFYVFYRDFHYMCSKPYDGITEIFDELLARGIKVALITGKGEESCRITLEELGLTDVFCDVKTGRDDRPGKDTDMLQLLDKYKITAAEFIYIGDVVSDVTSAHKAGVTCLSAAWADQTDIETLKQINDGHVIYTVSQLQERLKSM